ncbi:MAG: bifunctional diaminohydroxyphosphoribosylaminopyrimidine deaminase/5-amino-6-(5-phosphoribosylamino)uracil reductase RibD [Cyanobacteria bacterium]|nr:bifunctional diaminohydroxyphosphoribosylaminopyrimidine deaminase/5-amino-6-(5-phosphoribosylamino)uracil reductase RibD [Cyanobacteriota bacterium]
MAFITNTLNTIEDTYIARCLTLAEAGRLTVSPNPMVGAVVLDSTGKKVGEGAHQKAGEAHAELIALAQAGNQARGGTLFVNLEPCNHHGKTPPCTEAIIESGIERVVCGTLDPNPLVSGSGRDRLQNARISVRYGFLEEACQRLNEIFFHHISTQSAFITLKMATTLDGKIATRSDQRQWITGPLAQQFTHQLRHQHDAVLTTAETVRCDDPALTVRVIPGITRQPIRLILDRRFRLNPSQYQIFNTAVAPVWVFTSNRQHHSGHAALAKEMGVQVFEIRENGLGLELSDVFEIVNRSGLSSVLVEAGGKLAGRLVNQGFCQKILLFQTNRLLPDPQAKSSFCDGVQFKLEDGIQLKLDGVQQLENDRVLSLYPIW